MHALQPLRIEKTAGVADDQPAIEVISWHRVPAAVGQRFRAIAHQLAAFENVAYKRMRLPDLKRRVGIETRVLVFEGDHQTNRHAIVRKAVNPAASVRLRGDRPTQGVRNVTRLDFAPLYVPQLLDAQAIGLWIDIGKVLFGDELFRERTARAFGQHSDLGSQFVAWREICFGVAVSVQAFIFGDDTGDAVAFVDQIRAAKFLEDADTCSFD